jgi:uncharacterized lipoprotein YmbA
MKVASLLLIVLLAGCASQPIESKFYLMRSQQEIVSRQLNPSRDFSIGTVVIASYIDQPGLLIETSNSEVRAARHHLWAEPVYESVHNELTLSIGRAKGEDILPATLSNAKTVIDIRIDQLHGTSDGKAKLVAYWWLRQGEDVISVYQFAEEKALAADGYSALVAAEEALLQQLGSAIAATLVVPGS